MSGVGMDGVNWRILMLLQENARTSFSEIGRQVGLTPTAVAERVRRLEDAGVIRGYRVAVSPEALGYAITAFVRVVVRPGMSPQVARLCEDMPEVLECHRVTGEEALLVKIVATSVHHLEQLLLRIRAFGQPMTSVVLSTVVEHPVAKPAAPADSGNGHASPAKRDEIGARTA
jgi:Lrp/AsnC family leucine-responsive transcriptional regulator